MSGGDVPTLPTIPHATDVRQHVGVSLDDDGGALLAMELLRLRRQGHPTNLLPDAHYPVREDDLHAEFDVLPRQIVNIVADIPGLDEVRARFDAALAALPTDIVTFVDRVASGDVALMASHFAVRDTEAGAIPLAILVFTFESSGALMLAVTLRAFAAVNGTELTADEVEVQCSPHHFVLADGATVRLARPGLLYFDLCQCLRTINERATPME